jgi:hypothetical protein
LNGVLKPELQKWVLEWEEQQAAPSENRTEQCYLLWRDLFRMNYAVTHGIPDENESNFQLPYELSRDLVIDILNNWYDDTVVFTIFCVNRL